MYCSAQNLGLGAQTADHWVRTQVRARGQRTKAGLAGGGGDHAAGHGALGGPCLCGAERRREVPAAGRLPAVAGAQPTHPRPGRRAQARAHGEHALRPRHLQLREVAAGQRGGVPHAGAGQGEVEGALPLQARVAGHHAGHQPQQAHGRERSEPGPGLQAPRAGSHMGCYGGKTWVYCNTKQPAEHEGVAGAAPHGGRRKDT